MNIEKLFSLISASELARRISRTPDPNTGRVRRISAQAVHKWRRNGIPADRCMAIEAAMDGAITRYEMRADVFGTAPESAAA